MKVRALLISFCLGLGVFLPTAQAKTSSDPLHPVVVLNLKVDQDGNPFDVWVAKGYSRELNKKAVESVKKWKFAPAIKDGHRVAVIIQIVITFDCASPNVSCEPVSQSTGSKSGNQNANTVAPPTAGQTDTPSMNLPVEPSGLDTAGVSIPIPRVYPNGNPVTSPRVKRAPDPVYPTSVQGVSGTIILELVVDETGSPENIKVLKGLDPDLDKAAIEAVQKWRFFPTKVHGRPVKVLTSAAVTMRPPA